jgi:PRC-barrel domain protein
MRRILPRYWNWAVAALLLVSLPAAAEDVGGGKHVRLVIGDAAAPPLSRHDAERLIGRRVRNADRKELGRVDDLLFDSHGTVTAAVIELDGFLGLAKRKIAVDRGAFRVSADDTAIVLAMTPEQLQHAPTYVERRGEPIVGAANGRTPAQ